MRTISALALFLLTQGKAPGEEVDAARDALLKAVAGLDRFNVDRSCATLVRLNDERTPDIFIAAFRAGLLQMAEIDKERVKLAKEMEKVEPVRDKTGLIIKGDPLRWQMIKHDHDILVAKIDILTGALPRVVSQMSRLTVLKPIIIALQGTPEWYPRACCAEALGRTDSLDALAALIARAKIENEPGVRVAISDALAPWTEKSDDALKAVLAWTEGGVWESRLAAAQAATRSGNKQVVPRLIKMLQGLSGRMKFEINECLRKLTKADKHGEFTAWTDWWDRNENEFLAGTYVPSITDKADPPGQTTFYGIPLHSTKVIFIIDVSLSMKDPTSWKPEILDGLEKLEGDRAIDVARYELRRIVRGIPEGALYDIIGMHGRLSMLSEKWVVAGRDGREKALKFIQSLELKSGTDVHGAMIRALDFSGGNWNTPPREDSLDTVFILTDGVPSVGLMDRGQIPDRIVDAARFKRVAFTTIAIDPSKEGREILRKIAEGTGGAFVMR